MGRGYALDCERALYTPAPFRRVRRLRLTGASALVAALLAAVSMLIAAPSAFAEMASVHGGYATTTAKCEVCHSGHRAAASGDTLLVAIALESCEPCHLGASATSNAKVSEGNMHGESGQCTNGYCHSVAPHGVVGVSKFATLRTALLTDRADSLLDAAIASGASGSPVRGTVFAADSEEIIGTMAVDNPGVTAVMLNDVSSPEAIALGRAVGTGYVCANGGCHINGQFNSMIPGATLGEWEGPLKFAEPTHIEGYALDYWTEQGTVLVDVDPYADGEYPAGSKITIDDVVYDVWREQGMRSSAVKGHTLAPVGDLATRGIAHADLGSCTACHDSIDYRISDTTTQFPHGNDRIGPDGSRLGGTTSAWFTVAAYRHSPDTTLTLRADGSAYTSASDGACLKCHRDAESGVGITY